MIKKHTIALLLAMLAYPLASHAQDGIVQGTVADRTGYNGDFRPIFNGKDLTGWDGNPELWSMEDGCITGKTTGPEQLNYNQFLIWRGGVVKNFELRAKVKQAGNNTGIQYRSKELTDVGNWSVGGYQCDIHPSAPNNAMLYGEKWGGILAQNGQSIVIDPEGVKWIVEQRKPVQVDVAEWHDYTIIAQGNHLVHKIDGQVTIDVQDYGAKTQLLEGLLAFQIHRGPAMKVQIKDVMLKELPDVPVSAFNKSVIANAKPFEKAKAGAKPPQPSTINAKPSTSSWKWLWSATPKAGSAARLKKTFDFGEAAMEEAVLLVDCDNGAQVFLNDQLIATNPDWQKPTQADVLKALRPGRNELRAEATNKGSAAAFIASLTLKFADGTQRVILTDASWSAAAPGTEDWKPVKVIADYGSKPWGAVFDRNGAGSQTKTKAKGQGRAQKPRSMEPEAVAQPSHIKLPPGFQVELIHTVSKVDEGSWVALTVDDQGRLIAGDQYGGLYRLTPPPIGSKAKPTVEKLAANIQGAHGLLHAFDSLYVMVNQEPDTAGLWRLRAKADGQFEERELIRAINGRGEHGNHSLALSPDGRSIYLACGNGTAQPTLEHTRGSRPIADDQVLPRISKGAASSDTEPQAITCKISPDGKRLEMISSGNRNHYGLAFNALGDLFTYDSDMEWDAGTPWYRPTRIYQLISGGDYGFRESSGKLHHYCPDVVPPLVNVGPGSPTGMCSGLGSKFPAKYQHAIFACDWTYGTLYAVHPTPEGAGYRAELEEFVTGKPLPLTNCVIGKDGAMYFTIGGRRTQSALYRVTYTGDESTAPAEKPIETPEHKLRVELERLHEEGPGPEAIDQAWPHLGHADRLVRWAARVAIERQPASLWADRAVKQTETWAVLESAVALARVGGHARQKDVLKMLHGLHFTQLDAAQQLALVRVYQITIARSGVPADEALKQSIAQLDAVYPSATNELNTELSRTLVALDPTEVVAQTLKLMAAAKDDEVEWLSNERLARNDRYGPKFLVNKASQPNVQQISYAYALRMAKAGWTAELRRTFFTWFSQTAPWEGGNQFRGFLTQIRSDALANVADKDERQLLDQLSIATPKAVATAPIVPPRGPGKNYSVEDVLAVTKAGLEKRSLQRGRELYIATGCQACHKLGNESGGIGPDLTGAGSRYTLGDLLENIIEPSKVISDQYESTNIETKDGKVITGRITSEDDDHLYVATNPADLNDITTVEVPEMKHRKASPVSLMPPGLINSMNEDEVRDLLAYLLSGGDAQNKMFKK